MKRKLFYILFVAVAVMANAQNVLTDCKEMHKVEKKETIYGIAQKYGLTVDEFVDANPELKEVKLKKGAYVCIPYTKAEKEAFLAQEAAEKARIEAAKIHHFDVINIAVILPFGTNENTRTTESQKCLEFYRGFLLAVDSLKSIGVNINVNAYEETANMDFNAMLNQPELSNMNLLIGPGKTAHIDALARFATQHNIPMVIPTTTKSTSVNSNGNVFQISTPKEHLYDFVRQAFDNKYKDAQVVYVLMNDASDNMEFYNKIHSRVNEGITLDVLYDIQRHLVKGKKNVIIPSGTSEQAFMQLVEKLATIEDLDKNYDITVFGYPEWQQFAVRQSRNLSRYKAVYFTPYFDMPYASRTKMFLDNYQSWFKEKQHTAFPKYGEIGYDIGARFLLTLNAFGDKFDYTKNVGYVGIQTPMHFVQLTPEGTAFNDAFMFINFRTDGTYSLEQH